MDYKHRTAIQVRFKDTDQMGHVNNANHFTYLEVARVNYFSDVVGSKINWTKQGVILARAEINYVMPIMLDDNVSVLTRCIRLGTKSFSMEHKIVKTFNGVETELANGISVVVCFDYEKNASIAVPEEWKVKARAYDKIPNP